MPGSIVTETASKIVQQINPGKMVWNIYEKCVRKFVEAEMFDHPTIISASTPFTQIF